MKWPQHFISNDFYKLWFYWRLAILIRFFCSQALESFTIYGNMRFCILITSESIEMLSIKYHTKSVYTHVRYNFSDFCFFSLLFGLSCFHFFFLFSFCPFYCIDLRCTFVYLYMHSSYCCASSSS